MNIKKILIFGSTGSVGKNALSVAAKNPEKFQVTGLCVNRDITTLLGQIKKFSPAYVCVVDKNSADKLEKKLDKKIKLFKGEQGLEEFSTIESDISIMAISGIFCLKPLLWNIKHTKRIALANKESIITAGQFVFREAEKYKTEILPVDSEINSFYQLLNINTKYLDKVYLTASGGALLDYKHADIKKAGINEVLSHPTWNMGRRITVDSATLVNKGFEVVETHCFFNIPYENINIVIHRESKVHAFIEFKDGTVFACLYPPDMKIPISFALYYPQRSPLVKNIDFKKDFSLRFMPVDYKKFPLIKIILEAAKREDNSLVVLNAADEVAVDSFLKGRINFEHVYNVMNHMFTNYSSQKLKKVEDVFFWDEWAREKTKQYIDKNIIKNR